MRGRSHGARIFIVFHRASILASYKYLQICSVNMNYIVYRTCFFVAAGCAVELLTLAPFATGESHPLYHWNAIWDNILFSFNGFNLLCTDFDRDNAFIISYKNHNMIAIISHFTCRSSIVAGITIIFCNGMDGSRRLDYTGFDI